jgi:hypothetical protein
MTAEICIGRECVKRVIAFVFITPDVPQRGAMQGDNHGFAGYCKEGWGGRFMKLEKYLSLMMGV